MRVHMYPYPNNPDSFLAVYVCRHHAEGFNSLIFDLSNDLMQADRFIEGNYRMCHLRLNIEGNPIKFPSPINITGCC